MTGNGCWKVVVPATPDDDDDNGVGVVPEVGAAVPVLPGDLMIPRWVAIGASNTTTVAVVLFILLLLLLCSSLLRWNGSGGAVEPSFSTFSVGSIEAAVACLTVQVTPSDGVVNAWTPFVLFIIIVALLWCIPLHAWIGVRFVLFPFTGDSKYSI